jgi:hypothetical protein
LGAGAGADGRTIGTRNTMDATTISPALIKVTWYH